VASVAPASSPDGEGDDEGDAAGDVADGADATRGPPSGAEARPTRKPPAAARTAIAPMIATSRPRAGGLAVTATSTVDVWCPPPPFVPDPSSVPNPSGAIPVVTSAPFVVAIACRWHACS
jgi:hypothetical protein